MVEVRPGARWKWKCPGEKDQLWARDDMIDQALAARRSAAVKIDPVDWRRGYRKEDGCKEKKTNEDRGRQA